MLSLCAQSISSYSSSCSFFCPPWCSSSALFLSSSWRTIIPSSSPSILHTSINYQFFLVTLRVIHTRVYLHSFTFIAKLSTFPMARVKAFPTIHLARVTPLSIPVLIVVSPLLICLTTTISSIITAILLLLAWLNLPFHSWAAFSSSCVAAPFLSFPFVCRERSCLRTTFPSRTRRTRSYESTHLTCCHVRMECSGPKAARSET